MTPALTPPLTHPGPRAAEGRLWQWSGPPTLLAIRSAGLAACAWLSHAGAPDDELAAWELLFAEGANNVALHGGGPDPTQILEIDLRILPDRIVANIIDQTEGFDWPDTTSLPDDDSESGRGLFIIEALTTARYYHRGHCRNTLTLERQICLPHALTPPPANDAVLEETLDSMTEELSACYESLSAIFRFTAEARQTTTLTDFADRLLRHLVTVTSADYGMLRVVTGPDLTTLATQLCHAPAACPVGRSPYPMEAAAVTSRQDQWIEPGAHPDQPQAGLVHPFYHDDELMGLLTIGRRHSTEPLNAGHCPVLVALPDGLVDPRDLRSPFPSPDEAGEWLAKAAQGRPTAEALKAALLTQIGCIASQGPTAAQADDQTFLVIACDAPTPST